MDTTLYPHTSKGQDGKYVAAPKCDCCGKATNEAERYTDDEVCAGTDGPGFYLCHRKRCIAKRDLLDLAARTTLYTAQRAANDEA